MSSPSFWRLLVVVLISGLTIFRLRSNPIPRRELVRRLPRCVVGLACFGVGIGLFFASHLGTGPWDVLHAGLAERLHLPVGVVINLVGVAILPLWVPLKEPIGLGTALNALEIGFVLDLVRPHLPTTDLVAGRVMTSSVVTIVPSETIVRIDVGPFILVEFVVPAGALPLPGTRRVGIVWLCRRNQVEGVGVCIQ